MKKIFFPLLILLSFNLIAQEDKTVTLTVSGQGKSQDEAKQNALRNAIEQAFGAFISSKTEILNDELVKDEIVSIANGNIQKFEVISEVEVPEVGHATTLKATVSVTKLTSFVESKGVEIEFKGSLFGANLRQQRINENAELQAIINLCEVSNQILSKSIDYSIEVDEPVKASGMRSYTPKQDDYQILFTIKLYPNKNFDQFVNYFYSSIKAISMPVTEQVDYKKLNKNIYLLTVKGATNTTSAEMPQRSSRKNEKKSPATVSTGMAENFYFRNPNTVIALQNLFLKSNQYLHNFRVVTNLDNVTIRTCCYDNNSLLGSQNMMYVYSKPEIWHLNSGNSTYSPEGSRNNNPGYPQFTFFNENRKFSSWRIYFEYLLRLRNNAILFESNNYFTQNGSFYKENGNPAHYSNLGYPFKMFPGIQENIGEINLAKIVYYCKYLAIYSEEEISKLTKISVEQFK